MEVPRTYKKLYQHWAHHSVPPTKPNDTRDLDRDLLIEIEEFATARMRIWERKYQGDKPLYTQDQILQHYRFCNIYRELDRQTVEIHQQLRSLLNDFPLWLLNIVFQRMVCNPMTVKQVGLLSYSSQRNAQVYANLRNAESPKYGHAYVFPISAIQQSDYPTREEFFCGHLPQVMQELARQIQTFEQVSVNQALQELLPRFGFNLRFHWTEVLIDVAYQFPEYIDLYHDFHIGPGAITVAKRLNPQLSPGEVADRCVGYELPQFPYLTYRGQPVQLSAENWEGIFCEFRKYTNLKKGTGRKRIYRP